MAWWQFGTELSINESTLKNAAATAAATALLSPGWWTTKFSAWWFLALLVLMIVTGIVVYRASELVLKKTIELLKLVLYWAIRVIGAVVLAGVVHFVSAWYEAYWPKDDIVHYFRDPNNDYGIDASALSFYYNKIWSNLTLPSP